MLGALSKAIGALVATGGNPARDGALASLAATFRALDVWAHGAHLLAKGTGFSGDHVELLGPLYVKAGESFDAVSERALGLGAPDAVCEPAIVTRAALGIVAGWPTVSGNDEHILMRSARDVVQTVIDTLSAQTRIIQDADGMTRGLDNLLAQLSDDFESFAYKFGRRVA